MNLQQHISSAFPEGLEYNEAAQLCLRLYISLDGVPVSCHAQCNKDDLAETFACLSESGLITGSTTLAASYGANFHNISEKGHWIEVIASVFKKGDTVDSDLGTELVKRLAT